MLFDSRVSSFDYTIPTTKTIFFKIPENRININSNSTSINYYHIKQFEVEFDHIRDILFGDNMVIITSPPIERPKIKENINWGSVILIMEKEIDEIVGGTYHEDNDNSQYVYEEVAKAIYGEEYFKWINKNT